MQAPHRYAFATLALSAFALGTTSCFAQAQQGFPSKPIRLVVATSPGSQPDGLSRMLGQKLSESWARPVVMDNRPGAGGSLAATMVAKAATDGHTILYALPNFAITAVLQPNHAYEPLKQFTGITQIGFSTNVLVVAPSLGVKSVNDLITLAKSKPGKLIFGSGGAGTAGHLSAARLNVVSGIKAVHVAFNGAPQAAIEVLTGRAQYHVGTMGVTLPFIQEGKLIALAVMTPQRSPVLPDVPALAETLPEFRRPETSHAILAPAGTPRAIIDRINQDIARILELPDVKERVQSIGFVAAPTTPDECNNILRSQLETLSTLVSDAGLRAK